MRFSSWLFVAVSCLAWAPPFALAAETPKTPAASPVSTQPSVKVKRTEITAADNWSITCTLLDQPNAKRRCSAELRIIETENNAQRVVFTWIVALRDGKLTSVVSTPSGVLIVPGVKMKVGDRDEKALSYSLCQPDHREAVAPLDELVIKLLTSAGTAEFTIIAVNGNGLKFTANLKGIEEALSSVTKS